MPNHYDILGVAFGAEVAIIRKAYHQIALTNHPDKTQHLEASERAAREKVLKEANNAWEVLSDTGKRREYDQHVPVAARMPASIAVEKMPPKE
jgi:molecular chaperone DnaJ